MTLDPDQYVSENPSLPTATGKFYTVNVPSFGATDSSTAPDAIMRALGQPSESWDRTWPPYVDWPSSMSTYIRLGSTPNRVDKSWKLAPSTTTPPGPPTPPSADDTEGLLTASAMLGVLDWTTFQQLINYCGHREHTDGNRIVTTYGNHVNVVNGDYHNITLSQAKWEHDNAPPFADPGFDTTSEDAAKEAVQGIANHYLCCDMYYDVMSTWFFPDGGENAAGERPLMFNPDFAAGNADDVKGTKYDGNDNLIPDYYEYVNAENLRETVCASRSHAEKLFAGKALSVVCTRYGDDGHTHSEKNDFADWSDGDLMDRLCTRNYKEVVTADGSISSVSTAGAAINEVRTAGGEIADMTVAGLGMGDTRVATHAMLDVAVAGGAIVDLKGALGAVVDVAVAGGAIVDIKYAGGLMLEVAKVAGGRYVYESEDLVEKKKSKTEIDGKCFHVSENVKAFIEKKLENCAEKTAINTRLTAIKGRVNTLVDERNEITQKNFSLLALKFEVL